MHVDFDQDAAQVAARLSSHAHDKLWEVLERILEDPEAAQHAPWASYVASHRLYGSKIPGTSWTVFWRPDFDADLLLVGPIADDLGI
jgi:hypothetical protein